MKVATKHYKCPRPDKKCGNKYKNIILFENLSGDLPHLHLECSQCKYQWNEWEAPTDKLKEVFGAELNHYL